MFKSKPSDHLILISLSLSHQKDQHLHPTPSLVNINRSLQARGRYFQCYTYNTTSQIYPIFYKQFKHCTGFIFKELSIIIRWHLSQVTGYKIIQQTASFRRGFISQWFHHSYKIWGHTAIDMYSESELTLTLYTLNWFEYLQQQRSE